MVSTDHLPVSYPGRAPSKVPKETAMPFSEKGDVRIRYEMVGSGFPLLVTRFLRSHQPATGGR